MNKDELLHKIEEEQLSKNIFPYRIILNKVTDSPLVIGCALEDGKWKVFKTRERGGHYVIKEFTDENDAYDYYYKQLLVQKSYKDKMKEISRRK